MDRNKKGILIKYIIGILVIYICRILASNFKIAIKIIKCHRKKD